MYYPEYAEIDGKEYKIDTDFKTALKCFEVCEDETISDYERGMAIIYLLFDFIPEEKLLEKFLEKAILFLQCGKDKTEQSKNIKDMDFNEDRGYIASSFMLDYHLDLSKVNLHFWQFIELLEGLSEDTILNRVRTIRTYDLAEIKDTKQQKKMKEVKEKLALKTAKSSSKEKKLTDKQKKNIDSFYKAIGYDKKE